jgi:hypothetical protein
MNEGASPLLAQLQDIHGAGDPGWWPPAPGWWILAVLLLAVLVFLARIAARKLAAHRRKKALLAVLESINQELSPTEDSHEYLARLNRLFRVVALRAFPGTGCARLEGESWVGFLASLLPEKSDTSSLSALSRGPYEPNPEFDFAALNEQAKTWVRLYG